VGLVVFIILYAQNNITDSLFLSHKSTAYTLLADVAQCVVKVIAPFFLITASGGLFLAFAAGVIADMFFSFIFLAKKFNYVPSFSLNLSRVQGMISFSLGNYVGNLFQAAAILVVPIIITMRLNPTASAYYYLAMMIANLLYVIPTAVAQSLFAEGSHSQSTMRQQTIKAIKLTGYLLVPTCIFIIIFGSPVLKIFGHNYSSQGIYLLRIFTLSAVFVSINQIGMAILKVLQRTKEIVYINLVWAAITLSLSYFLVVRSLNDVAYAWMVGQVFAAVCYGIVITKPLAKVRYRQSIQRDS
jgi:O-antigen/teichoic acid export membrane protein